MRRRLQPMRRPLTGLPLLLVAVLGATTVHATDDRIVAARGFLDTLDPGQQDTASAAISAPDRDDWSYLPGPRPGLRIADLDANQLASLDAFLETALGAESARRVRRIRDTEPIEDRGGGVRLGPDEFRVRFFGLDRPGNPPAWSWRIEGHHLSLHQTFVDGRPVSITPIFLGSVVRRDGGGEVLGPEDMLAHSILRSIPDEHRAEGLDPRPLPGDLRTAMRRSDRWSFEGGVPLSLAGELARDHADLVVDRLLAMHPEGVRRSLRQAWSAVPDDRIVFAWCGREDRRGPHQWRLVSPVLVVEFSHSGGNVEHGHLVLRTPTGEFPDSATEAWNDAP